MKPTTDLWGVLIADALLASLFGVAVAVFGGPAWASLMTVLIIFQIWRHTRR